jgi:pimeloyl-ACP methyl ester carboxylesterase
VGIAGLLAGLAFLAWFIPAKAGWLATDREEMIERYAQPPSRFIEVDGVPIHVRVEGEGFPVLMLHGTGVNLHEWDPLAERMKDEYQVIRLDWPPYGLSGPNPRGYTTPEAARLVGLVLDELGVEKVATIATSNGSNVALLLNQANPERIAAMAFSIIPLERPSQTRKVDWRIRLAQAFHKAVLPNYHPRIFYQWVFESTGHKGWKPPEYLSQMMYDMSNLPGAIPNQQAYIADNTRLFQTTDVGSVAEDVQAPVLLQWCWEDTVISQGPDQSVARFTNTDVTLIEYDKVGHWPMWEIPDLFADDIKAFLEAQGLKDAPPSETPATQAEPV